MAKKEETLKEVDNRLEELISSLEKDLGKEATAALRSVPDDMQLISSGIYSLDNILGGGVPQGRIIEIMGWESSGKSTLALYIAAQVQAAGGLVAYIDAEHALDIKYCDMVGLDTSLKGKKWLLHQPSSAEEALTAVESSIGIANLVVIDSVAALVPQVEIDGELGDSNMGVMARLMGKSLRRITGIASKSNTTIIFINQFRQKIGVVYGDPKTTPGGNALKFYASQRLDVSKKGMIKHVVKGKEHVIGQEIGVKVIKNKVAPPYGETSFSLFYGKGIDVQKDMVATAITKGIVTVSGSWYNMGETKLGQGLDNSTDKIFGDPALKKEFLKRLESK